MNDTLRDIASVLSEQEIKCTNCGSTFTMNLPEDKTKVSDIIKQQYEKKLCDKCFTNWYNNL